LVSLKGLLVRPGNNASFLEVIRCPPALQHCLRCSVAFVSGAPLAWVGVSVFCFWVLLLHIPWRCYLGLGGCAVHGVAASRRFLFNFSCPGRHLFVGGVMGVPLLKLSVFPTFLSPPIQGRFGAINLWKVVQPRNLFPLLEKTCSSPFSFFRRFARRSVRSVYNPCGNTRNVPFLLHDPPLVRRPFRLYPFPCSPPPPPAGAVAPLSQPGVSDIQGRTTFGLPDHAIPLLTVFGRSFQSIPPPVIERQQC